MILAGDVGGTKTRLAFFDAQKNEPIDLKVYPSKKYPSLQAILQEYLSKKPPSIDRACIACPGSIVDQRVKPTNLPWHVDASEISSALRIKNVSLLNDLEAAAHAIPILPEKSFRKVHAGEKREGNRALISPGTGLGEAGIFWHKAKYFPFASEGGHCDFAPQNQTESDLRTALSKSFGHVSYERLLSGPGLVNIYTFLQKGEWEAFVKTAEDPAAAIATAGLKRSSPICNEALDLFASILGAEAGNLALKMMAFGGIYLGGGIPPKIVEKLEEGKFYTSFLNKGRLSYLLEKIPINVILDEYAALKGCASYINEI